MEMESTKNDLMNCMLLAYVLFFYCIILKCK